MEIIFSIICFMVLICILIAVHEYGHLLVARANGVFVESFSIGCGPVLLERKDKQGTKWRFSLIPIGGYVKMIGDADVTSFREVIPENISEEEMELMSIHRKKPWQKLAVAAGGPMFNFIFAITVLIGLAMIKGVPTYTNDVNPVSETSLAYTSGIREGDKILSVNSNPINNFNDIKQSIIENVGKDLILELQHKDGTVQMQTISMYNVDGTPIASLGITPAEITYEKTTLAKAIIGACETTYTIASENIKAIFQIITNKRSTKDVGGIISIFKAASDSAEAGFPAFIWMMAFLSIILGAINLLPIPVLDGGTIMISAIEWVIGRPLGEKLINTIFFIGLIAVSVLMLLGIWNDLEKCKVFEWARNLFH